MTENELAQLYAEVYQKYGTPELGPDEFTIQMFASASGKTYNQASNIIEKAVRAGELSYVGDRRMSSSKIAHAYKRVTSP